MALEYQALIFHVLDYVAESGKSALPICNHSQILYQFLTFTQNLKRSPEIAYFVLDNLSISVETLVKTLPHLRYVAVFTNVSTEIMIWYAQKQI